jgi:CheY-like chemotaxis protein
MSDTKRIYISDQNAPSRAELRALLESRGYLVRDFSGGEAVMEVAAKEPPDLFITSMGLDGELDGVRFTRALKAVEPLKDIPIVFYYGARRVMNLPFNFAPDPKWLPVFDVVEKPARPDYLLEVVEKAIASAPAKV